MTLRLIHHIPPPGRMGAQGGASRSSLAPLTLPQARADDSEARLAATETPPRVTPPRPARWRPSFSLVLTPLAVLVVGLVLAATAVMDSFRRQT